MLRNTILLLLLTCIFIPAAFTQQRYRDSIEGILQKGGLSPYRQTVLHCQLARAYFETDLLKALLLAGNGTEAAGADAKAWVYATRVHLLVQQKNKPAAYAALDSALLYENQAKEPLAKGMVWLRNGWLDVIDNENDRAVSKLLKALDYFKGPGGSGYGALTCHYLASIYSYGADEKRQGDYARQCLELAAQSGEPDMLNTAYYTVGQHFYDQYKLNPRHRGLLDSALEWYHRSIALSNLEKARVLVRSNTAGVALNTANIYFQHYPANYKDSVFRYLDIGERIAMETRNTEILINCYAMRSEYALQSGNTADAEQILLSAISLTGTSAVKMPLTQSRIYRALARVAEQRHDTRAELNYLKNYIAANAQAVSQEREANAQLIDARYRAAGQEQKIRLLEQETAFARRRNWLYIGLGIAVVTALALLLVSYNYRLKASLRKRELIDKEKEEAVLKIKLQEAETNQLLAEKALLRERQERLEKELLAEQLQKEEKNQLMELLADKNSANAEQVKRMLKRQQQLDEEYEGHKSDFVEVRAGFFEQLRQRSADSLTRLDMKYCAYILMGLSNKEISARLNIEPKSIRMARYRIKQKLGLGKEDHLDQFIKTLG